MLFKNQKQLIDNGQTPVLKKTRKDIIDILTHSLDSVNPFNAVKKNFINNKFIFKNTTVDLSDFNNIYAVGFGKASVGMAQAVSDSTKITKGVIVTNDTANKVKNSNIKTLVGSHPIPGQNSINAADEILKIVENCEENDLLFVLISGGGSALLCKPQVKLGDIQKVTELLLKSGADINEINTIRKHLSYVKGGQLLKNSKCRVISLIVSDIVGDPISFIASGPTYPDDTSFQDAKNILQKYKLWEKIPQNVVKIIDDGITGKIEETPKMGDSIFKKVQNFIVANNEIICNATKNRAESLGYKSMILTTNLSGEAKDVGRFLAGKAKNFYSPSDEKHVFITGGETTVTITGKGSGGRNQEMVLSVVKEIAGSDIVFVSFATDSIDGNSEAAGAIADGFTYKRAEKEIVDPALILRDNNSYAFF